MWRTVARWLGLEVRSGLTYGQLMASLGLSETTTDGAIAVTEAMALNLSAVWCAVQNIAGTVGSLPLILYKRTGDDGENRVRYAEHPLYRVLHDQPNPEMSSMVFRETVQAHVLLWGNGYAEIQRDQANRVRALLLITPDRVTPKRDDRSGALYYEVRNGARAPARMAPADIFHVRGPSWDGITGYSVVAKARQSLGLGLQTERFGATLFGNGPKWSGILTHPKTMRPETKAALRADLKNLAPNDFAMLEEGLTWNQTGMPAKDAEFLATRQFQVEEIARWFNMPPHKLKDLTRATFSNIEHEGISYLTDTIRPWLVRWEQEIQAKLISPLEQQLQYAEHLVDALLRADSLSKAQTQRIYVDGGILSVNEIRRMENRNAIEGEVYELPHRAGNLGGSDTGTKEAPPPPKREPTRARPDYAAAASRMLETALAAIERDRKALPSPPPVVEVLPAGIVEDVQASMISVREETVTTIRAVVTDLVAEIQRALPPPLPEAPPGLEEPDPSDEETPAAPRYAEVMIAQRQLIADVVRRMQAREKDKARAAAKSPERLRAWVGAFYPKHAEVFRAALLPHIAMHLALTASDGDPDLVTRALVEEYLEGSRRQLHALLDAAPADLPADVEALFARWDIERTHSIPDTVMREEMAHHG